MLYREFYLCTLKSVAENFALGNFYLNPETEMYIRADFPEADSDVGFKPGIIIKTVGGLNDETPGIGQQGYISQLREYYPTVEGYDDLYTGTCVLQAVAQHEQEALNIAYLTMLSINKFKSHLLGREGIVDVHAMSLSDVYPYRAGAYVDAFASTSKCDMLRERLSQLLREGSFD